MEKRIEEIIALLDRSYPDAKSELRFENTFQLLVAVILSARCTDKRVNKVTPILFGVAPNAESMRDLPREELDKIIFSCGFYREKAAHIQSASADVAEKYGGEIPAAFEDLVALAGVGRKTANVVTAVGFNKPAFAVDTHVFRVSSRLGIVKAANPLQAEKQLTAAIDENLWNKCHHLFILHGRYVCKSQRPDCPACTVNGFCVYETKMR